MACLRCGRSSDTGGRIDLLNLKFKREIEKMLAIILYFLSINISERELSVVKTYGTSETVS